MTMHCECEDAVEHGAPHQEDCLIGAIHAVAYALLRLGNGNASTDMGAVEGLAVQVKEGLTKIADAVYGHP